MSAPVADPHQLAGHAGNILKLDGGRIMKLVKDPEANFYTGLAARNLDPVGLEFIPKFFGIEESDGKSASFKRVEEPQRFLVPRVFSLKNIEIYVSSCSNSRYNYLFGFIA